MLTSYEKSILEILQVVDKPTWDRVTFFFQEIRETLAILSRRARKDVYENAQKRCECCGRPLGMVQGNFHFSIGLNQISSPITIQFLCPTDHRIHGYANLDGKMLAQYAKKQNSPYGNNANPHKKLPPVGDLG